MNRAWWMCAVLFVSLHATTVAAKKRPSKQEVRLEQEARDWEFKEKLHEADAQTHFKSGQSLYDTGRYAQACQEIETAIELHKKPIYYKALGWCYIKLGRKGEAATQFGNFASEIRSTDPEGSEAARDFADAIRELPSLATPELVLGKAQELWLHAQEIKVKDPRTAEQLEALAGDLTRAAMANKAVGAITAPAAATVPSVSAPARQVENMLASTPAVPKPPEVALPPKETTVKVPAEVVKTPSVAPPLTAPARAIETKPLDALVTQPPPAPTKIPTAAVVPTDRQRKLKIAGYVLIAVGSVTALAAGGVQLDVWLRGVPQIRNTCGPTCSMDPRIAGVRSEYTASLGAGIVGGVLALTGIIIAATAR